MTKNLDSFSRNGLVFHSQKYGVYLIETCFSAMIDTSIHTHCSFQSDHPRKLSISAVLLLLKTHVPHGEVDGRALCALFLYKFQGGRSVL